jgi:hypothetical protein
VAEKSVHDLMFRHLLWVYLTSGIVAYKLFQILVEESDRAVHGCREVFGDVVIVAVVGVQVGDAACVVALSRQTTSVTNDN